MSGPQRGRPPADGRGRCWLPTARGYRSTWWRADVVAGLTTGAVVIPQAMAYATIAGLPVQVGLYTCMVPILAYAMVGTGRTVSVSTTSTIATLVASTFAGAGIDPAGADPAATARDLATLVVLVGVILLLARALRLGSVVENISQATLIGIKAGVGLTVAATQLPKILGVPPPPPDTTGFAPTLASIARQLGAVNVPTLLLAAGSIAVLLVLTRVAPRAPATLMVVLGGIAIMAFTGLSELGVATIPPVPSGLPLPTIPTPRHITGLIPGALALAVMAFLETVSVARAVRPPQDPPIDSDRELLATGVSCAAGGLFAALPSAGGFSQTAVNTGAGARTQIAALVTAALAVLVAVFLASALHFLPQATLGALVLVAVVSLLDLPGFVRLARLSRLDFWIALLTAVLGLTAGLLPAVAAGVIATLALVLREIDRPDVAELRQAAPGVWVPPQAGPALSPPPADVLVLSLGTGLYTANTRATTDAIMGRVDQHPQVTAVVLDLHRQRLLSLTVADGLQDLARQLDRIGVALYLTRLPPPAQATIDQLELGADLNRKQRITGSIDAAITAAHTTRQRPRPSPAEKQPDTAPDTPADGP